MGPAGDNPAAGPIETLQTWNNEGVVRYLGPAEDIRPRMIRCSVYALPSWYHEGIPRTNMEALAMGKPVVTTDMPGCRETVVVGENGFPIPPGDEDALVDATKAILGDPSLAQETGAVSREPAVKKFRVEAVNRAFLDALSRTAH
jgi:glycosyltransferase involved in cell wall biosynthesis